MPEAEVVYHVRTFNEKRSVSGVNSCIVSVPPGIYVQVPGGDPAVNLPALGRMLRQLSEEMAARIRETLHHADWVITSDPAEVERIGMHGNPHCGRCRAGVDQARAALADRHPELLVGTLYWAL